MKLAPYVEKLNNSSEFKQFIKKNNDAFMMAGFFILDYEFGKNMHQIDYYIPSKKKVAAFTLDKGVVMQLLDTMIHNHKAPEALDAKTQIDLEALQGIIQDEMKNRNMTEDIKKMIAILQTIEGKKIWNINCVLSGMEILRAHVEDESKSVLKMEKASIMQYIQKVPGQQLAKMAGGPAAPGKEEDPKAKIKDLQALEEEIEREKKQLESQADKPKKPAKKPAK